MALPTFDLDIASLRAGLTAASRGYTPDDVREIVLTILLGKNYRRITEKATRLEISVFMSWLLDLCHRAVIQFGEDWLERLQEVCARRGTGPEAKWLRVWLMGLALKTTHNLGIAVRDYPTYLQQIKLESDAVLNLQPHQTSLELRTEGTSPITLSGGDSAWLLQIAGAAVLTLRGSKKSSVGKLLEKAIARACLTALGLKENEHFNLNLAADEEVEREIDAEVNTRRGRVRMDVALIGTGNQEVSEDKLSRVGRNGIVIVDKLGPKSKVPGNASKNGVELIIIQNNLLLSALYNHLSPLMPASATLKEPPTNELELREMLKNLPDSAFMVPTEATI